MAISVLRVGIMNRGQALKLLRGGFEGVQEWNTRLQNGEEIVSLRKADLRGADLRRANLSGADLSGADLTGADFTVANLVQANLRMAHLAGQGDCAMMGNLGK